MLADEAYCVAICDLLRPKELSLQLSPPPKPQTQVHLKTPDAKHHGIADMLIETKSAVLLVEVKLTCGLTGNQDFGLDDAGRPKLTGYLQYLEYRKREGYSIGLCLLAPRSWKPRPEIENQLRQLKIPAQLRKWEDVEVCIRTANPQFGKFVREFGAFLENNLMSISFTEDESSLLTSRPGLTAFGSASVKLQELVKQAAKELEAELAGRSPGKFKVKDPWGDATEYGAVVSREDKHLLWFGIWAVSNWPLVVGYDEKWAHPDLSGFPAVKACEEWKAFGLPKECFTGEQPRVF